MVWDEPHLSNPRTPSAAAAALCSSSITKFGLAKIDGETVGLKAE